MNILFALFETIIYIIHLTIITVKVPIMYAAVHRQNALTLILEIVEESDFSDAGYNATYVSDVQSLITKSTLQQFFGKIFPHKI